MAPVRRHLRHLGRRDERGGDGRRADRGRPPAGAGRARAVLEARVGRGAAQPPAPRPARDPDRALDARLFAGVRGPGHRGAGALAVRHQPLRLEPAHPDPGGQRPFRPARRGADQALRHRDQRAHGPRPRVPQRRSHARRAARLGVPAHDVPGRGDRRRSVLGRRLLGQPVDDAADPRMPRRRTRSWCRSTRSSGRARRRRRARSTTG